MFNNPVIREMIHLADTVQGSGKDTVGGLLYLSVKELESRETLKHNGSSGEISAAVEEGLILGVRKHIAADTQRKGLCKPRGVLENKVQSFLKCWGFKASEEFYSLI